MIFFHFMMDLAETTPEVREHLCTVHASVVTQASESHLSISHLISVAASLIWDSRTLTGFHVCLFSIECPLHLAGSCITFRGDPCPRWGRSQWLHDPACWKFCIPAAPWTQPAGLSSCPFTHPSIHISFLFLDATLTSDPCFLPQTLHYGVQILPKF